MELEVDRKAKLLNLKHKYKKWFLSYSFVTKQRFHWLQSLVYRDAVFYKTIPILLR